MANRIQIRRDTAANWTSVNPVLAIGEMGYETDTAKFKFGNGVTAWTGLSYTTVDIVPATSTILGGVKIGANVNVAADGTISVAAPYVHPTNHPPSIITQDANNRFVTDTEKTSWNGKADTTAVTTTVNGLMIAADKSKLDGIAANANNYSLPIASATILGGIKVGSGLAIDAGGVLSTTGGGGGATNLAGLSDVADTIAATAGHFLRANGTDWTNAALAAADIPSLDTAKITTGTFAIGRIPTGTTATTVALGNHTHADATTTTAGFFSATDKTKLNGIEAGANNYVLPTASATVLGGVKVGTNLSIDANGVLSASGGGSTRYTAANSSPTTASNTTVDVTVAELTIPAGALTVGMAFRGEMWGQFDQGTAGGNLVLWMKVGTDRTDIVNSALGTTASTNNLMRLFVIWTTRTISATGIIANNGMGRVKTTDSNYGNDDTTVIDTTGAVTLSIGYTFTVASTAHVGKPRQGVIWQIT